MMNLGEKLTEEECDQVTILNHSFLRDMAVAEWRADL